MTQASKELPTTGAPSSNGPFYIAKLNEYVDAMVRNTGRPPNEVALTEYQLQAIGVPYHERKNPWTFRGIPVRIVRWSKERKAKS